MPQVPAVLIFEVDYELDNALLVRRAGRWMYLDGDVTATLGSSAS